MTFTEAVRTCLKEKYVNFRDRAPRSEFWWFVLFGFIVSIVAGILDGALGFRPDVVLDAGDGGFNASYQTNGPIATIAALALLLPNLGVSVRRLHDIGKSGWWVLLVFIPLIGILVLIWWWTRPSEEGPNKWGPNPFDPAGTLAHDGGAYSSSRIPSVDRDGR